MNIREIIKIIATLALNDDEPDNNQQQRILAYINLTYQELAPFLSESNLTSLKIDDGESLINFPKQYHNVLIWGALYYLAYDERDKSFAFSISVAKEKFEELKSRLIAHLAAKKQNPCFVTKY